MCGASAKLVWFFGSVCGRQQRIRGPIPGQIPYSLQKSIVWYVRWPVFVEISLISNEVNRKRKIWFCEFEFRNRTNENSI